MAIVSPQVEVEFTDAELLAKAGALKDFFYNNQMVILKINPEQVSIAMQLKNAVDHAGRVGLSIEQELLDRPWLQSSVLQLYESLKDKLPPLVIENPPPANYTPDTLAGRAGGAVFMDDTNYNGYSSNCAGFDKVSINEAIKYQIALAAANAVGGNDYRGHTSEISVSRQVKIMVFDGVEQAKTAFSGMQTGHVKFFPCEDNKFDSTILSFGGVTPEGLNTECVMVSREYLKKNLAAEIEFLKSYEEKAKSITAHDNACEYKVSELIEEQNASLNIKGYKDYAGESVAAPLAKTAGAAMVKSL